MKKPTMKVNIPDLDESDDLSNDEKIEVLREDELAWKKARYAATVRYRVHRDIGGDSKTMAALVLEVDRTTKGLDKIREEITSLLPTGEDVELEPETETTE
jgi:hypothetical protein